MLPLERQFDFGPFRLLPAERRLLNDGREVRIGGRALDILAVLAESPGQIVSAKELSAKVWPNLNIEQSGLRVQIAALRKVLGRRDDGGHYIQNVVGRGYTLFSPVTKPIVMGASAEQHPSSTSLPERLSNIVGRAEDVVAVSRLLLHGRCVTISGAGGIGKTALSIEIAHARAADFEHGVCFVDVSLLGHEGSIAEAIEGALGLPVSGDSMSVILNHLRARQMLLLLDCCERATDRVAEIVRKLLLHAPGVRVIVTSRAALMAEGEQVYALEPLGLPPVDIVPGAEMLMDYPATQLFCLRARAGGFRGEIGPIAANLIVDICRKADGVALAVELAASRVITSGLKLTADQLNSRFGLGWQHRRTAVPRHQTLSAMLDWSYDYIELAERALLRKLSVFVGWFSVEEAVAVAGPHDDLAVVDMLLELVVKSLVTSDTARPLVRYRLLDTTRSYARAKLAAEPDEVDVLRRYAQFYLNLMLPSSARSAANSISRTQLPNVRAALEWALASPGEEDIAFPLAARAAEIFLEFGMVSESQQWAERALSSLPPRLRGTEVEAILLAALGHSLLFTVGNTKEVVSVLERALALTEATGEQSRIFGILSGLHFYYRRKGENEQLLPIAHRATAVAKAMNLAQTVLAAKEMLAVSYHMSGNLPEALMLFTEVQVEGTNTKSTFSTRGYRPSIEIMIARTLFLQGFPDQAASMALAADPGEDTGNPAGSCLALCWATRIFYYRGDWDRTNDCIVRISRYTTEYSLAPYLQWYADALRGELLFRTGVSNEGIALLRDSLRKLVVAQYGMYVPWITGCLAEALCTGGYIDQGLVLMEGIDPWAGKSSGLQVPETLRIHGALLFAAGDVNAAENRYRSSLEIADAQGALSWRMRTAISYATLLGRMGRSDEALSLVSGTYGRFTEGFKTADLRAARDLIATLEAGQVP